jgi:hypothetical protein
MTADMTEFFEIDPELLEPDDRVIRYRLGKNTGTAQYVNIRSVGDEKYLREIYKMFLEHIRINRNNNADQINFYNQVYVAGDPALPKPDFRRTGLKANTWESFLNGLEDNFDAGTMHYTTKQWPHVIDCVNIAIGYFNNLHPHVLGKRHPQVRAECW